MCEYKKVYYAESVWMGELKAVGENSSVLPEKSRAHTPSWWKPLNTDMGFNVSVSHMWMEESLPTWINKNIQCVNNLQLKNKKC